MKSVGIVDYGLGNIKSVVRALDQIGFTPQIVRDPGELCVFDDLVLPGVGSFKVGIDLLRQRQLVEPLLHHMAEGKRLLGICLGMQLLFSYGTEGELRDGLGIFQGEVKKISGLGVDNEPLRLPIVGYYPIQVRQNLDGILKKYDGKYFYFVHSYMAIPTDSSVEHIAYINYQNSQITAYVRTKNVLGLQFHPEKSGRVGLDLMRDFFLGRQK